MAFNIYDLCEYNDKKENTSSFKLHFSIQLPERGIAYL
jgi:hypothetical protein